MGKKSKGVEEAERKPIGVRKYLGLAFVEYEDGYDLVLGKRSRYLSRIMALFTLAVVATIVTVGLVVKVHVKVPVAGQMQRKEPKFLPAVIKGRVTVNEKVIAGQEVKAGDLLVTVESTEQDRRIQDLENDLEQAAKNVTIAEQQIRDEQMKEEDAKKRQGDLVNTLASRNRQKTEHEGLKELKLGEFDHQAEQAALEIDKVTRRVEDAKAALAKHPEKKNAELAKARDEVSRREIELRRAQEDLDREERLFEQGIGKGEDLERARTAKDLALTNLSTAKTQLAVTELDLARQENDLSTKLREEEFALTTQQAAVRKVELDRKEFLFNWGTKASEIDDSIRKDETQIETVNLEIENAPKKIATATEGWNIAKKQEERTARNLAEAKEDLERGKKIVAPEDGTVQEILVQTGQEAQPGQPVIKFGTGELEFVGMIEKRHRKLVLEDQDVTIKFVELQAGRFKDLEHPGKVTDVGNEKIAQGNKESYLVRIRIDPPKKEEFRDRMPEYGYGGTGNILTERMTLLRYWVFHKVLKKV